MEGLGAQVVGGEAGGEGSHTRMSGWLDDCRTGGLEGWGVIKGRFIKDMKAPRGSAAFRSLCEDCGTFDARIGGRRGCDGMEWDRMPCSINVHQ